MHWACGLGDQTIRLDIVELLLANSGNPNIKSNDGVTPVHVAVSWGFLSILKMLVAYGGDPWYEDPEGFNAWDLALQKNQWSILKYLASYMEEDPSEPAEDSVQCVFVKHREVDLGTSLSNSTLSCNNLGFLGSESVLSASCNTLNVAICNPFDTINISSNSVIVEEHIYSDTEKGVELLEWHYPPLVNQDSITDATLNEALCTSSDEKNGSMESQILIDELKLLGKFPGPITPTTKQVYLRQLFRLRKEQAINVPSPKRLGVSKELQSMMTHYPGQENDVKIASHLDRLLVTHFTCPDPLKPWREGKKIFSEKFCIFLKLIFLIFLGLSKKSFNYLLLDPRVTHNLPLNESQDQRKLFQRFVSSIFYIGKGKQTRPHGHLYEAIKLRSRPQSLLKVANLL